MTLLGFEAAKPKKKREDTPSTQSMRPSAVPAAQRRNLTHDEKRYKREQRVRKTAFSGPGYYLVDKDGTPQSEPFATFSEAEAQLQPDTGHLVQYLTQAPNAAHIAEPFPPNLQQVNGSLMTLASHTYDDEFLFVASSDEDDDEDTSRGEADTEEHPDCAHCHHSFSSHGSTNGGPCEVCSCEHYDAGGEEGEGGEEKEAALHQANKYIKQQGDSWVIIQKGTGKVLSHHDSEEKANEAFRAMEMHKHEGSLLPQGMTYQQREAQILHAMAVASLPEQQALMGELDGLRREARMVFEAEREIDLSSAIIRDTLTPVRVHEHHTASTDWIDDVAEPGYTPTQVFRAMITEAKLWSDRVSPAVKADREEYVEQAHGTARRLASMMGEHNEAAYQYFMKAAGAWGDDGAPESAVAPWGVPPMQLPPVTEGNAPFGVPGPGNQGYLPQAGGLNGQNYNPMAEETFPGSQVLPLDNGASAWPPADNLEGEGPLPPAVAPDNYNSVGAETHGDTGDRYAGDFTDKRAIRRQAGGHVDPPEPADIRDRVQRWNEAAGGYYGDEGLGGDDQYHRDYDFGWFGQPHGMTRFPGSSYHTLRGYDDRESGLSYDPHGEDREASLRRQAARSIAGEAVDESYLAPIVNQGRVQHGERFDDTDLRAAKHFAPYYRNGARLKVRRDYGDGEYHERTGTVGKTTGWKPAFLLMHRSSDRGSSDVLGPEDEITHIHNGRQYVPVRPATPPPPQRQAARISLEGMTRDTGDHLIDVDRGGNGLSWSVRHKRTGQILATGNANNSDQTHSLAETAILQSGGRLNGTYEDYMRSKAQEAAKRSRAARYHTASEAFNGPKQTYADYLSRLSDGAAQMEPDNFAGSMAAVSPAPDNTSIPVTGSMVRWGERGIDPDPTGSELGQNPTSGYGQGENYDHDMAHAQSGEAQTNLPLAPEGPKVTQWLDWITDFPDTGPGEVPSDRAPMIAENAGQDQDADADNDAFKQSLSSLSVLSDERPLDERPHPFQRYANTRYCRHCGEDPNHAMHIEAARIMARDKVPGRGVDQQGPDFEPNRGGYAMSPEGDAQASQDFEQAYSSDRHIDYSETGIGQLGTVPVQGYGANPHGEMFAWQVPPGPGPVGAADVINVPTPGAAAGGYPQPSGVNRGKEGPQPMDSAHLEAPEGKEARLQVARARVSAILGGRR